MVGPFVEEARKRSFRANEVVLHRLQPDESRNRPKQHCNQSFNLGLNHTRKDD